MNTERLAAFSDGVIAIIITIMVLDLKVPHSAEWAALAEVGPVLLSYALSFVFVAIYWNNHHHLLHTVTRVNGAILWANNNLLFWLSLVPFVTAWIGETHFARQPTILYGFALLMPALSYFLLTKVIMRGGADDSKLAQAIGHDFKGKISIVFYVVGIVAGFFLPAISYGCYLLVAIIWLVPDPRIERSLKED